MGTVMYLLKVVYVSGASLVVPVSYDTCVSLKRDYEVRDEIRSVTCELPQLYRLEKVSHRHKR